MSGFGGVFLRRLAHADHVQSRLAAGLIERAAQHLAIDRHHPLQLLRELPHKPLKGIAKLIRIEIAKQPAEGVMAGQAVGQGEKAAQKWLFGLSEQSHIYRTLTAAQHAAQSDHQQFAKVMQRGIPVARILQPFPTRTKLIQSFYARHDIPPTRNFMPARSICKWQSWFSPISNAIALTQNHSVIISVQP